MESVRVVERSVVVPSEGTPMRRLWLSSLDVDTAARGYVPVMYLYGCKPDVPSENVVERLKAALADALVPFYPVAGRLAADSSGRPEIDCNAKGVLFTVARSDDLTADYVRGFAALSELRKLFVPTVDVESGAMWAVQLTFLKCGGVVMGTALHHVLGDAPSAANFIRTWCMMACGSKLVDDDLPCHDRGLMCARSPPTVDKDLLHSVMSPKISLSAAARPVVFKVFHVSADQVADLKRLCQRTSTFRAVTAHVWRCAVTARGLAPGSRARISFLASLRRHVRTRLPPGYFGNTSIMLSATAAVTDIVSGTLASISDTIGAPVQRLNNEVAHSAIDYLELELARADNNEPPPPKEGSLPDTDLKVVSWLGMPTRDADFGLGMPEFTRPPDGSTPGVVLLDSADNGDGVLVSAYLEPASINQFGKLLSTTPAY